MCVAVCCSVSVLCCSVCVVACCSVLHHVAACCRPSNLAFGRSRCALYVLQRVAARCSVLQYVAACCSVLYCVAGQAMWLLEALGVPYICCSISKKKNLKTKHISHTKENMSSKSKTQACTQGGWLLFTRSLSFSLSLCVCVCVCYSAKNGKKRHCFSVSLSFPLFLSLFLSFCFLPQGLSFFLPVARALSLFLSLC